MDSGERNILKNIYKIIIATMLLIPITILIFNEFIKLPRMLLIKEFIYPFIVISIIINITIWSKYYDGNEDTNFQIHIKELIRNFLISGTIFITGFFPILLVIGDNKSPENGWVVGLLCSWLYYIYSVMNSYSILKEKNERVLKNFDQYECLKNIYSKLIILIAITPIGILFFWPFSFIYVLIPNIFIFEKYYKYGEDNIFQDHIKSIFIKSLIATFLCFIGFCFIMPALINTPTDQAIGSVLSIVAVTIIYLVWYSHSLNKKYKKLNKDMFY